MRSGAGTVLAVIAMSMPAQSATLASPEDDLQCVTYARAISKIAIYGDAWTWWDQAEGRYARGSRPKIGAILAMPRYRNMVLGHVAAVSRIIDARTILLRHANWSPIAGLRGQTEDNVPAVDVSPANDWSEVRIWFAPLGNLGTTRWPVSGFIYNEPARGSATDAAPRHPQKPSAPTRLAREKVDAGSARSDPIGDIIARFAPSISADADSNSHGHRTGGRGLARNRLW